MTSDLTLSVVSHDQGALIDLLLADLAQNVSTPLRVLLTLNRPEDSEGMWAKRTYPFEIEVVRNVAPKGFGANHNAALARTPRGLFCVLNPDIRVALDPFPVLIRTLADPRIGVVAPSVTGPELAPEDHARDFPSLFTLAAKAFGRESRTLPPAGRDVYYPDWVAGMFMLFRHEVLLSVGGFDERYFLYYEDVDLCARLRERGFEVAVSTKASVIHAARRQSRGSFRFASWHLRSAMRFLASRPRIALGLKARRQFPVRL